MIGSAKKIEYTNPVYFPCLQKCSWIVGDEIPVDDRDKGGSAKETVIVDIEIRILKGVNIDKLQTTKYFRSRSILSKCTAKVHVRQDQE